MTKGRQGVSDEFLKVIFKFGLRTSVSRLIAKVRNHLTKKFVPLHLGLQCISREEYIANHVTDFSNALYNSDIEHNPKRKVAILTVDGTYIPIHKPSNFAALRRSYCVHKGKHLVKPIMVVAPNGYILDVHGPFFY